jgi:predicted ATPase/DNA-binding winged helix-turn-helix (wHTH) protein
VDDPSFLFGPFRLAPAQRVLLQDGKPLRLGSRALDILITLVERAGEIVGNDDLVARVWPNLHVEEANLRVHVAALRKALSDTRAGSRFIANVPGRGYSFVAPVSRERTRLAPSGAGGAPPRHNLPVLLNRVIGRTEIVTALAAQLQARRFLSIVGPGGIGKTTVAVAIAETLAGAYEDGVWFVGLSSLSDPRLVPGAVMSALGHAVLGSDAMMSLLANLRDKRALILLDNCEHVVEAAAALAVALLKAAPGVHVLATSREPLRADGEWIQRLPSLAIPPKSSDVTAADALTFSAVQLFNERAVATRDGFALEDDEVAAVIEICRQLDGIPLALELAAARLDAFGIKVLANRIDDRFLLATRGHRTALPRHQTLNATLDWSFEMLSASEAALLCRLAVFAGDFTLASAVTVAAATDLAPSDVVTNIADLVEKSLVTADVGGDVVRYRLLNTTRVYGRRKLAERGEHDDVARRHAAYHCAVMERAKAEYQDQPTPAWLAAYRDYVDDVRAALDWSFSPGGDPALGVALTIAALPLWTQLSLMAECRQALERALSHHQAEASPDARRGMQLHAALGVARIYTRGQAPETAAAWTRSLAAAESLHDTEHRLQALFGLWNSRASSGELVTAMGFACEFRSVAAAASDPADVLIGDRMIGSTLHFRGDQAEARRRLETMRDRYVAPLHRSASMRHQVDQRVVAQALLARILWLQGFPDQATRFAAEALESALATDQEIAVCYALVEGACPVALFTGNLAAADRFVAMLLDRSARHGLATWHILGLNLRGELLIRRGEIADGVPRLRAALEELREVRLLLRYPAFLGVLAEGCAAAGEVGEALTVIDQALASSERTEAHWCLAELLRIKGGLALLNRDTQAGARAEGYFRQACELSRRQATLSWQLRAAVSLARLCGDQGRGREGRDLLRPIHDRFTEGFQTADLVAARALIDALAHAETR